MGYKLETTALISIDNYSAFRIRCIMLILGKLKNVYYFTSNKHSLTSLYLVPCLPKVMC